MVLLGAQGTKGLLAQQGQLEELLAMGSIQTIPKTRTFCFLVLYFYIGCSLLL